MQVVSLIILRYMRIFRKLKLRNLLNIMTLIYGLKSREII